MRGWNDRNLRSSARRALKLNALGAGAHKRPLIPFQLPARGRETSVAASEPDKPCTSRQQRSRAFIPQRALALPRLCRDQRPRQRRSRS